MNLFCRSKEGALVRNKSELLARDRYARCYAAVKVADALVPFRAQGVVTVVSVEAEDVPLWDDIVEADQSTNKRRRHQVKKQLTPLAADGFGECVKAASDGDPETEYRFAYPVLIDVIGIGEIRILSEICDRVQQVGANIDTILGSLRPAETVWVDAVKKWTGRDDKAALNLLRRLFVDIIGGEKQLHQRGKFTLMPTFKHATDEAWDRILAFVDGKDGAVEIHPADLLKHLPPPAADAIEAFYWSMVRKAEYGFAQHRWASVSDHLASNLVPQWFHDNVLAFVRSVRSAAWPKRHPALESAMANLANRAVDYIVFFDTRSESDGKLVREDKSYKRSNDLGVYQKGREAARAWDRGVHLRLINVVVALNELFDAVRKTLDEAYRLDGGKIGIHDEMGVLSPDAEPAVHHYKGYIDIT